MYEQYYGLSAPPFQIHPDPGFYFESKGHGRAYQYLRFGAFQGEGFVVVTGEIGAGKTTLLRALLAELDPEKVVAAQLVSTQLASDELLSAVALAFGIRVDGQSKARLLVTLEAFLATLATSNRRALLIIDEAQNLSLEAIEELRMLSNFQFGNKALLQSFLVGQPDLRELLLQPRLEQLRQRVLASCHLGPMESTETRGYIEHRLRHVGWQQRPHFDSGAFDAIHLATAGVPRRINTLCNRLLLSAFLDEAQHIDAARVRRVDLELRAEVRGLPLAQLVAERGGGSALAPLLCVAGSAHALQGIGALLRAFALREDLPQVTLLRVVAPGAIEDDAAAVADFRAMGLHDPGICVPAHTEAPAQGVAEVCTALAAQLQAQVPSAMLLVGDGWVEAACAMVASVAQVPLVSVQCGGHDAPSGVTSSRNRALLGQLPDLLFKAADPEDGAIASRPDRLAVGSLALDAMRLLLSHSVNPEQTLRRENLPVSLLADPAGYVLVCLRHPERAAAAELLVNLDSELRKLGWRVWLLCTVGGAQRQPLAQQVAQQMAAEVRVISAQSHAELLGLMRHARCVVTDDAWLWDQSAGLGVPVLLPDALSVKRLARELAGIISGGERRVVLPEGFDGRAAERIAANLSDWLFGRHDSRYQQFLDRA